MERALIRVDFVITTEDEPDLDVDHFITGEEPTLHRVANSLFDGLDVFPRNRAAGDLVLKHKTLAGRRLDLDLDVTVLATTASLLLINFFTGSGLRDRFTIRNLRLADVGLDTKLALHAIDDDLEVQLTHTRDDRLAGFLVRRNVERRIFLGESIQRDAELVLVLPCFRLDRNANHGCRKLHPLEDNRLVLVANGVAGRHLLHAADGDDLPGTRIVNILALVRVHAHQPADALLRAFDRIVGIRARFDGAAVDADKG